MHIACRNMHIAIESILRQTYTYQYKMNDGKNSHQKNRGSPLYPGMCECVGQIPAKLGLNEKLLNKKSGKPSQN